MYELHISEPAKRDLQSAFEWWRDHRSSEQAARWYRKAHQSIKSLQEMPARCPPAVEADLLTDDMRQLAFGIGRRPTHRIVFAISGDIITILRIRHASQDALTLDDLDA